MSEEIKVVSAKELEKIRKNIDDALKKSASLRSVREMSIRVDGTGIDEKDKKIINYIRYNPEIIKQNVIDAFNKIPGYSRKPILKRINRLEKLGMIIVKPDEANSQIHHLSVNYVNELSLLIVDLDSFKACYFNLIDKIDYLLKDKHLSFDGFLGLTENYWLVNAVLTPLKLILNLYNTFDLFLPVRNLDSESLHRKFAIIRTTIIEIQTRLHNSILNEPLIRSCDSYFANTSLYENLNLTNNILNGAMWGVNHKNIESMLVVFEKYGLSEISEALLDSLWKLIDPIFLTIYPWFNKKNCKVKDWRSLIRRLNSTDDITHYWINERSSTIMP
jgi:hypothetical protein